jgi:multiple sugar transport system substrate-binding protein
MRLRLAVVVAGTAALALGAAGCGGSGGGSGGGASGSKTIKVAYEKFGTFVQMDQHMQKVKTEFEQANPGSSVQLIPIAAAENDYYTKLNLMQRSPKTAPDVVYEDTFLINSDIQAGYLAPLDSYLQKWADWQQFPDSAKAAVTGVDGKVYGVPMGTDTRALWYNKTLFRKAGLPVPWQPKTWNDVLIAARTVKSKLPGVIPLNVYSGKPAGEASTMQGFEMLLYGTQDKLYDKTSQKWISSSKGFTDALDFVKSVYQEGLGPSPQQALDPNVGSIVSGQWLPQGKLAIDLDGSWLPSTWIKGGPAPWPEWNTVMGTTMMPTQNGQPPGGTSMSGGWALSVTSKAQNPSLAFGLVSTALNKDNSLAYDIAAGQIPVRKDVAADPKYLSSNPTAAFFGKLVDITTFRPALPVYPRVSDQIQVAMESVMTGQASPQQATSTYGDAVKGIVGPDKVQSGS